MAKSYHREDLRGELVGAAYAHVAANGHDDLSIRKLAALVGVSSGAPYHHFPDRRALLIAIAERAFERLRAAFDDAIGPNQNHADRIAAVSHAFLDFAERECALFDLMYDSELTRPSLDPAIAEQYRLTYLPILDEFTAYLGCAKAAALRLQIYWSTIFGFAFLSNGETLGRFAETGFDDAARRESVIIAAIGTAAPPI